LKIRDGYLFITMGERYYLKDSAQSLSNHLGKVIRLNDDGRIPSDNPFVHVKNAKPEMRSTPLPMSFGNTSMAPRVAMN
jgi:aldose sugar dehydrogenase